MNGLHANICVLRIGAVQAERIYIFVQWKFVWEKIKMSVTSAYIECATGNWYHRIELTDSFLLKYRYWTFTKIIASASRKNFWTSDIATSGDFKQQGTSAYNLNVLSVNCEQD